MQSFTGAVVMRADVKVTAEDRAAAIQLVQQLANDHGFTIIVLDLVPHEPLGNQPLIETA